MPTLAVGFVAAGNLRDPLKDPYLAILELLILLMVPLVVALMAAVYAYSPRTAKTFSLTSLSFMVLAAGTTSIVHVVGLTVGHQVTPAMVPGYTQLFSWEWPSLLYALDIIAWDLFLGLALLFAAPVFSGGRLQAGIRVGLIIGGLLCLAGLAGPAIGDIALRWIGEAGYAVVFPIVCLLLALHFRQIGSSLQASV